MRAPAKINLFLHVGPVKPNGRHDLDSLLVFAGHEASDSLEMIPSDADSLHLDPPSHEAGLSGADNLVMRALSAAREVNPDIGQFAIDLQKRVPIAAGLGGGSADAGAVLRFLIAEGRLEPETAHTIATALGGDVPGAVLSEPCLMRGEGEQVSPVAGLPPLPALLVNCRAPCPTGPVFRALDEQPGIAELTLKTLPDFESIAALTHWLRAETRNDLQVPAMQLVPQIFDTLSEMAKLEGAHLVRMSGSGASCFALFETMEAAERGAEKLGRSHPDWWVCATTLGGISS